MTTQTMDIRQEIVLKAPRETVWNALATPEGWTGWFSEEVQGSFQVGETLTLGFGKYGTCWAKVVERKERERPTATAPKSCAPASHRTITCLVLL